MIDPSFLPLLFVVKHAQENKSPIGNRPKNTAHNNATKPGQLWVFFIMSETKSMLHSMSVEDRSDPGDTNNHVTSGASVGDTAYG